MKSPYRGKFIVFEGIDGSGKSTQTKLLADRLTKKGLQTTSLEFPQYGEKSAGLVEEYLSGKYGNAKEVGPYAASIFYAVDRYDLSFQIRELLKNGHIIVSDRYVASNMGHQGAKITVPRKRKEFFKWLYDIEYGIFQIPKPTISFILCVPATIAKKLCENKERRKKKKSDIHEKDLAHLQNAEKAYIHASQIFPKDFLTVDCIENEHMLSPLAIHEKIWTKVQKFL